MNEQCRLTQEDFEEKVHIDVAMPLAYVSKNLINQLSLLEPFGVGNTKPVFAQKDIHILNGRILGRTGMWENTELRMETAIILI